MARAPAERLRTATRIQKTAAERATDQLIERYRIHLRDNYTSRLEDEEIPRDGFFWCYSDSKYNIWCYDNGKYVRNKEEPEEEDYIWLIWDGSEVTSYDDPDAAYAEALTRIRQANATKDVLFATSPLIVSAAIALILAVSIAAMLLLNLYVPQPLWSIFAAVVAFYFGREGGTRRAAQEAANS